jgi:surface antigen
MLVGAIIFVLNSPASTKTPTNSILASKAQAEVSGPLDQISSADIAVNVARMTQLPEATSVVNYADTVNSQLVASQSTNSIVPKPQVMSTTLPSQRDIQAYVVKDGETVDSIAASHGVSSSSVRWSNNLSSNTLAKGTQIYLPPPGVNGIVYTVKDGDTPASLASKYHSQESQIVAYNDAELTGLKVGERIIIPDGSIVTTLATVTYSGFAFGTSPQYGYNGYDYGWCTYYVASRVSVPTNWGNAYTWARNAAASGWTVSKTPHHAGDIAQTTGPGLGHVAYVEAVSDDGTMIKYSDMNGLAGWGRVGYSDWVPVSRFNNYIYR